MNRALHALILALFLCLPLVAEDHGSSSPGATLDGVLQQNKFKTGRNLAEYLRLLGPSLYDLLEPLTGDDHILDAGSGETTAMGDYLGLTNFNEGMAENQVAFGNPENQARGLFERDLRSKAKVTAVTFKMNPKRADDFRKKTDRLNLITDRYFEDVSKEEITGKFGKVSGIIDMWGVLAYTKDPTTALRRYMQVLKPGGKIIVQVGAVTPDYVSGFGREKHRSSMYRSTVDGQPFPQWLQTIPGLAIQKEAEHLVITVKDPKSVVIPQMTLIDTDNAVEPRGRHFKLQ